MGIDKEAIYDERVSPLVAQITEICKQEKIPFIMEFALREKSEDTDDLYCLTAIYGQEGMMETPSFPKAIKVFMDAPEFSAFVVRTPNEGGG